MHSRGCCFILAHYYYAYALSREVMTEGQPVFGFPADSVRKMRAELGKAIKLKPDFPSPITCWPS